MTLLSEAFNGGEAFFGRLGKPASQILPGILPIGALSLFSRSSSLEPSLERGGAFGGLFAKQQSVHADVLIEIGPMNTIACAADLKTGAFGRRSISQARIPADGHSNRAPIF
jgi:hypothetical protein